MKLRAIRNITNYELTGFGADNNQEGILFGENQVWSKVVIDSDELPTLSETAAERLKDYCLDNYPINPFIINYDETAIEQLPEETLFASITPDIVAANMDKFDYNKDLEFANNYEKTLTEVFPERYYEDTEMGVIRRKVDDLIANPELRYLDDEKDTSNETIDESDNIEDQNTDTEEVVEETTDEVVEETPVEEEITDEPSEKEVVEETTEETTEEVIDADKDGGEVTEEVVE